MEEVNKVVTLPLHTLFGGKGEQIVKRNLSPDKDYIFKPMSNQYVNRELKSLASTAKLKTRLTFHIVRHTFGTMLAEATQNPYLIMDLMGHADIKTSMICIHSSKERIDKQLRAANWNVLNNAPKIESEQEECNKTSIKCYNSFKKCAETRKKCNILENNLLLSLFRQHFLDIKRIIVVIFY